MRVLAWGIDISMISPENLVEADMLLFGFSAMYRDTDAMAVAK